MGRGFASPQVGAVYDIIMDQRGRVDELDTACKGADFIPVLSEKFRAQDREKGTDPLPAGGKYMIADRIDRGRNGRKYLLHPVLGSFEVRAVMLPDLFDRQITTHSCYSAFNIIESRSVPGSFSL